MNGVETSIAMLGGVARASELYDLGHPAWQLRMLSEYGRIIRVRKGWYACSDLPDELLRAWRVGGRLACVSALIHFGLIDETELAGRKLPLHVAVPSSASKLRMPDDHRRRLDPRGGDVVVHWEHEPRSGSGAAYSPATDRTRRLIVSLETAIEQAENCRPRVTPGWSHRRDTL